MSFASHLRIGRLGADGAPFLPLDWGDVHRILERLADRGPRGSFSAGRGRVVGHLAGLPLVYHSRGFLDLFVPPFFGHQGGCQDVCARLGELCDRLGCVIYHVDAGEDWTDHVRQWSARSP
jgi:hypothetical protein